MPKFTASCSHVVALPRAIFSCVHVFLIGCCTHDVERALSSAARAPLCRLTVSCGFTSARTRIRWPFTCLICVSVTATRPCPPRTRHHCNRRHHCGHRRRRHANLQVTMRTDSLLLAGKSIFKHMYASTFMRPCSVWLDSEACSRARRGESTLGEGSSRHNDTSSVSKECSLTVSMFRQALQRTQHHWNRRRRIVGKTGSDIHVCFRLAAIFPGDFLCAPRHPATLNLKTSSKTTGCPG